MRKSERTGDKPLFSAKEEAYAQQRAYGYRMRESARRAGLDDYTGIQTKYELKPRVQRRIDFLRQGDLTNEFYQEKRRHLEARLELVAFGSMFEYVVIGADGKPRLDWKKLAESDLDVTVAELRFDKDTGNVVHMARDSALNAIQQLRDLRGFKSADRHQIEITQVDQLTDEELARIAQSTPALPPPETKIVDNDDLDE